MPERLMSGFLPISTSFSEFSLTPLWLLSRSILWITAGRALVESMHINFYCSLQQTLPAGMVNSKDILCRIEISSYAFTVTTRTTPKMSNGGWGEEKKKNDNLG